MDQFEKEATKAAEEYIMEVKENDPFLNKAIATMVSTIADEEIQDQVITNMSMTIICIAKLAHDNEKLRTQVFNLAAIIGDKI